VRVAPFAASRSGCYKTAVAEISAFKGLVFDSNVVGDLARVVCPPYDVISESERDALEARSPHNCVRLVLPREEPDDDERSNKYTRARALLDRWVDDGVLTEDPGEALYLYEQRALIHGARHVQRGLLAAVSLEEPDAGGVLPHERTYGHIVEDRLNLLRAAESNLDCIMCVYDGVDDGVAETIEAAASGEPFARFTTPEDGMEHALWRIEGPEEIASIVRALDKATVVIADGHHRWTTARRYREERRATSGDGSWDMQLMLLVDASRFGPALLPIHRVVADVTGSDAVSVLANAFSVEAYEGAPDDLATEVATRRRTARTFGMFDAQRSWLLTLRDEDGAREALAEDRSEAYKDLDVSLLHGLVFDRLLGGVTPRFVHNPSEAAEIVADEGGVAFLLAPMPFDAVRAVAEAGDAMPQKSTYFVPKPKTGVVFRPIR